MFNYIRVYALQYYLLRSGAMATIKLQEKSSRVTEMSPVHTTTYIIIQKINIVEFIKVQQHLIILISTFNEMSTSQLYKTELCFGR